MLERAVNFFKTVSVYVSVYLSIYLTDGLKAHSDNHRGVLQGTGKKKVTSRLSLF